ncbi:CAP domain-containing protein [Strongyloides ratti]|nr:CAP domain-containing protein [Strongyloides ratti]CEF66105.1 CAP domain-containing protein [Strongyloides ratti]
MPSTKIKTKGNYGSDKSSGSSTGTEETIEQKNYNDLPAYTIVKRKYKNNIVYICNGQYFHSLRAAQECLKKLNNGKEIISDKSSNTNSESSSDVNRKSNSTSSNMSSDSSSSNSKTSYKEYAPKRSFKLEKEFIPAPELINNYSTKKYILNRRRLLRSSTPRSPENSFKIRQQAAQEKHIKRISGQRSPAKIANIDTFSSTIKRVKYLPSPNSIIRHISKERILSDSMSFRPRNRKYTLYTKTSNPEYELYEKFNIDSVVGKDPFSNRIWHAIWDSCNYKCFSLNNYRQFRTRLFTEINIYRRHHNVKPLVENTKLHILSERHARRIAYEKTLRRDTLTEYGETLGAAYYPAGSLIVKKWYDENKYYKYSTNHPNYGSQMFTQLVWKSSQQIGIGVATNDDIIFVVCKFYPKGNINNQYIYNVFKRRKGILG